MTAFLSKPQLLDRFISTPIQYIIRYLEVDCKKVEFYSLDSSPIGKPIQYEKRRAEDLRHIFCTLFSYKSKRSQIGTCVFLKWYKLADSISAPASLLWWDRFDSMEETLRSFVLDFLPSSLSIRSGYNSGARWRYRFEHLPFSVALSSSSRCCRRSCIESTGAFDYAVGQRE